MQGIWFSLLLSVHILVGLAVIGLVLLQHGKGADMGAAFGGGASGSLFGSSGSANFLSRTTAVLAAIFFMTSLGLTYVASTKPRAASSVMDTVKTEQKKSGEPASAPAKTPEIPADSKTKDIPK
jgi:preprotein translocase subunit SecG